MRWRLTQSLFFMIKNKKQKKNKEKFVKPEKMSQQYDDLSSHLWIIIFVT